MEWGDEYSGCNGSFEKEAQEMEQRNIRRCECKKRKFTWRYQRVQAELETSPDDILLVRETALLKELDVVLEQEEILWYQKSRDKWIVFGDRNTKYYHTNTIVRQKRNRIEMLKDDDGRWIDQSEELEKLAITYYKRLYSTEDINLDTEKLPQNEMN